MRNEKGSLTQLVELSTRVKYESQSWTGYNPGLIQSLDDSIHTLEEAQSYQRRQLEVLSATWFKHLIAITLGVIVFGLFITLWVAMGTSWNNEKKAVANDIRKELKADEKAYRKQLDAEYDAKYRTLTSALEKEDFEKLGYTKETVLGRTVWIKR
jgi:hypothetical protein